MKINSINTLYNKNNNIYKFFFLGLLLRCIIVISLILFPIYHEVFGFLRPFKYYVHGDMSIYQTFSSYSFLEIITRVAHIFVESFKTYNVSERYPGFILVFVLKLFNYNNEEYLSFCLLVFLIEIISYFIWLNIFNNSFDKIYLYIFTIIPISYVYFIFASIYLFSYFFLSIVIFLFNNLLKKKIINEILLCCILILYLFLKPDSLIIFIPIIFLYFFKRHLYNLKIIYLYLYLFFFIIGIFYYFPYYLFEYLTVLSRNNNSINFSNLDAYSFNEILNFYIIKFFKIFFLFNKSNSGSLIVSSVRLTTTFVYFFGFITCIVYFKKNKFFSFLILFNLFIITFFLFPSIRYILNFTPLFIFFIFTFLKERIIKT